MLYLILQWYIVVPSLLALLYWHGTKNFSHWRKHGIKHIPPVFFFGNIRKRVLFQQSFHEIQKELYFSFPGEKIAGTVSALSFSIISSGCILILKLIILQAFMREDVPPSWFVILN